MKIAIPYDNKSVHQDMNNCTEYLIFTVENGKPVSKVLTHCDGGLLGLLSFLGKACIDVLICGPLGIATRNALEMIGIVLIPGVTGSCEEAAAKFLVGEKQGDDTVLSLWRDEDPDDPMNCMHDCARCAGCGPVRVPEGNLDLPDVK